MTEFDNPIGRLMWGIFVLMLIGKSGLLFMPVDKQTHIKKSIIYEQSCHHCRHVSFLVSNHCSDFIFTEACQQQRNLALIAGPPVLIRVVGHVFDTL